MSMTPLDVFRCELAGLQVVEASAGTGKTWALCALVLRLLLERELALRQILVVTFTNAATAELRERIRGRIGQTLDTLRGRTPAMPDDGFVAGLLAALRARGLADDTLAGRLDAALQGFDEATIHTIHGFAQRALADHAFRAGVPLAQELLADDSELRLQAVQDFWRRRVAAAELHPDLAALMLQRGDTPESWAEWLRRCLAQPTAERLWPDDLTLPLDDGAALAQAFAEAQATWQAGREHIVGCVTDALPRLNGVSYKPQTVDAAAAEWNELLAGNDPLADVQQDAKDSKRRLLTTSTLAAKVTLMKGDKAKTRHPPPEHPFFDLAAKLLAERAARAHALGRARLRLLHDLLAEAPAALRAAKQARRVLAFDDLLQQLDQRLHGAGGDALAAALRARHRAVLIDESQDTDPLQWRIFQRLHGGGDGPLLLMGDPKQAIYGFRGADLQTYLAARASARAQATLVDNQRSVAPLLDGLNGLFGRHGRPFLQAGLAYHPVRRGARPLPVLADAGPPRAPLHVWRLPATDDGSPLPKREALQCAAHATAAEITHLLTLARGGGLTLDGRPVDAGDIAVLVRSHRQGRTMRRALAMRGVGCVELSQASVFHSDEAEALDRLLAAVLEPTREPLLRAALASVALGVDAAALEALAADEPRWMRVRESFADDRRVWLTRGVAVMLRRWMARERVAERLLARPDGERRLTDLLHLAELLQQAAGEHTGPEALHRWLQARRRETGAAARAHEAAQLRLESDRHLVQIVTIHKSKGLEYPFVFCPFLWDGAPSRARTGAEPRSWHRDDGQPVLDFASAPDDTDVRRRMDQETAGEELRLSYVALTRAVQRCTLVVGRYVAGKSKKDAGRSTLSWLVAGSEEAAASWPVRPLDLDAVDAAWDRFAAEWPAAVRIDPLPPPAGIDATALPPASTDATTLAARTPPARLPVAWRLASYSALVRDVAGAATIDRETRSADAAPEHVVADHDREPVSTWLDAATDAPSEPPIEPPIDVPTGTHAAAAAGLPPDDILRFPRGALAGDCLHAVFEHADFADDTTWPAAVQAALQAHPQPAADPHAQARQPAMLMRMLHDVLGTALPAPGGAGTDAPVLARIPAARRRTELAFMLPVERLTPADLVQAMQRLGWPTPALRFGSLRGYLRGFIDLVFEHGGRYHVLDWKSNHLGHAPADYATAALAPAVYGHCYHLQALLYLLALHRWLRHRLPDYTYERHVGGALVLFVRGVRPGWMDADGRPTGVWTARPAQDVVEALSDRLDAA